MAAFSTQAAPWWHPDGRPTMAAVSAQAATRCTEIDLQLARTYRRNAIGQDLWEKCHGPGL
eukprot:364692-Chlamydomonas_euryale.AAC.18